MTIFDPNLEASFWQARRSGTELKRPLGDYRDAYTRDRARVIHSAAFRRLQAKTQVLGIGEGDFHRTRLTHSMEAAQIARGIVRAIQANKGEGTAWKPWLPNPNLIETIALAHDLGHPPFGHGGEVALNYASRDAGGFEGNGQTLRLLSRLEAHTEGFGLDLTRRSLLGVLKYPRPLGELVRTKPSAIPNSVWQLKRDDWKPPKCYLDTEVDVVDWLLEPFGDLDREHLLALKSSRTDDSHAKTKNRCFDTSIMELADDIAYGVHDFEDAVALRLINLDDWNAICAKFDPVWARSTGMDDLSAIGKCLFGESSHARKRAVGGLGMQ